MCNTAHHHSPCHNPIQCIIPPHMLNALEMRGDDEIVAMARGLLDRDAEIRDQRARLSGVQMLPESDGTRGFVTSVQTRGAPTRNLQREVYDGENGRSLPGTLVRSEGDPSNGDSEVDTAYDGAGEVYELYYTEFDRDSLDGNGMKLIQTVNHQRGYNNAFWNGRQMVYGNGDGQIFVTFTELSVIAHEMSHGVVQFSGGLEYRNQSGALNESFADVFGCMAVQRTGGQGVYEADWLVGKGILGPSINGVALRSMKMPGTAYSDSLLGEDPQPYHMNFYVDTTSDNGGVHINSGIPNHAFYLYCMYLGGNSWGVPGQVWYHAMQRLNNTLATFHDWAVRTVDSALELYGVGAHEVIALRRAWTLVGIQV